MELDRTQGLFGIGTAAELVGMAPQSLRMYESRGLVDPGRTDGGTRRYSHDDLDRLRRISDLLEAGLNLAGIAMVLQLEERNADLVAQLTEQDEALPRARRRSGAATPRAVGRLPLYLQRDHRGR